MTMCYLIFSVSVDKPIKIPTEPKYLIHRHQSQETLAAQIGAEE